MIGNHALASSTDQAFLWARILYNPDLHAVSLFALSTDVNLLGLAGRSGPGRPCALLFRGQALLCIQKVSKSPQLSYTRNGTSTFTLCLRVLAAWEKVEQNFFMTFSLQLLIHSRSTGVTPHTPPTHQLCAMSKQTRLAQTVLMKDT